MKRDTYVLPVALTVAQYRLLGRMIRGERLPVARYRVEHATIGALYRKWQITGVGPNGGDGDWHVTWHGWKCHAAAGNPAKFAFNHEREQRQAAEMAAQLRMIADFDPPESEQRA